MSWRCWAAADTIVWEAAAEPGRFTSVSDTVEGSLGYTPQRVVGRSRRAGSAACTTEDRDRVVEAWTKAAEGERLDIEYRFATKDGGETWLWHIGQLVPASVRSRPRLRGLIVDVTERRRLEVERVEALRDVSEGRTREAASRWVEAEERFRALEQQVPAITYLDAIDGPQKTLSISEQTITILGYAPEDWYADPDLWKKIVHPEDADRLDAAERSGGFAGGIEYRVVAKDGRTVWLHDRSRLITDGDGVPRYWLGVLVDVTDRRRVHELRHELAGRTRPEPPPLRGRRGQDDRDAGRLPRHPDPARRDLGPRDHAREQGGGHVGRGRPAISRLGSCRTPAVSIGS